MLIRVSFINFSDCVKVVAIDFKLVIKAIVCIYYVSSRKDLLYIFLQNTKQFVLHWD